MVLNLTISAADAVTRFYLPDSPAAEIAPTFGAWSSTSSADQVRLVRVVQQQNTALLERTAQAYTAVAAPRLLLLRQYVSDPIAGQAINGCSIKGQLRAYGVGSKPNSTLAIAIRLVDSGGSARATLLDITAADSAATPPRFKNTASVSANAAANRRILNASEATPITLSNQTALNGDRIVVELGVRESGTKPANRSALQFGDDQAADLPEDDTTVGTSFNPWIEFSQDIIFPAVNVINDAD